MTFLFLDSPYDNGICMWYKHTHTLDDPYLEGRKTDGTSQADPQTHLVTETLAFTPRLQQTG